MMCSQRIAWCHGSLCHGSGGQYDLVGGQLINGDWQTFGSHLRRCLLSRPSPVLVVQGSRNSQFITRLNRSSSPAPSSAGHTWPLPHIKPGHSSTQYNTSVGTPLHGIKTLLHAVTARECFHCNFIHTLNILPSLKIVIGDMWLFILDVVLYKPLSWRQQQN